VGCKDGQASGIRTFQFGALSTLLGYQYGRPASRAYADAVARLVLDVQVGDDAVVRTARGDFYRPAHRGSFYLAWDASLRHREDKPYAYRLLDRALNMPDEYGGVLVSNMETTHDAYAFLVLYRCKKYGVACGPAADKASLTSASSV
jgi:hypothetical protein